MTAGDNHSRPQNTPRSPIAITSSDIDHMSLQSSVLARCLRRLFNCSVHPGVRCLDLLSSDTRHAHRQLPIQRFLLFLRGLHAQSVFYLGCGPESDTCPGHDADTEQGPGFGGETAVGAVKLVSFCPSFLSRWSGCWCVRGLVGLRLCHVPPERHLDWG